MSARARILAWVLLLVLLALAGSLLATRTVLHNQLDERLDNEIAHETNKLRAYLASPDSRPAGQAGTVEAVLGRHLERNLPEKTEPAGEVRDVLFDRRRRRFPAQRDRTTGPARHRQAARRRACAGHDAHLRHGHDHGRLRALRRDPGDRRRRARVGSAGDRRVRRPRGGGEQRCHRRDGGDVRGGIAEPSSGTVCPKWTTSARSPSSTSGSGRTPRRSPTARPPERDTDE